MKETRRNTVRIRSEATEGKTDRVFRLSPPLYPLPSSRDRRERPLRDGRGTREVNE